MSCRRHKQHECLLTIALLLSLVAHNIPHQTKRYQRAQCSCGKVQREHHLGMKPLNFHFHVPFSPHPFYIYPFSQKPPRQKEAHQSSFFKFTLHPMPRSSMVSLKQVRMAEKFTTIHYDSDAAGDAYTGLAALSKSFGKYRLAK